MKSKHFFASSKFRYFSTFVVIIALSFGHVIKRLVVNDMARANPSPARFDRKSRTVAPLNIISSQNTHLPRFHIDVRAQKHRHLQYFAVRIYCQLYTVYGVKYSRRTVRLFIQNMERMRWANPKEKRDASLKTLICRVQRGMPTRRIIITRLKPVAHCVSIVEG